MTAHVARCHPDRPAVARGLCGACYRLDNGYTSGKGARGQRQKRKAAAVPPAPVEVEPIRLERAPSRYPPDRCWKCGNMWRASPSGPELTCRGCGLEVLPHELPEEALLTMT
jgi:hypothetical protein